MENKKKIITGVVAGVAVLAIVIAVVFLVKGNGKPSDTPESTTQEEKSTVPGELVVIDDITETTSSEPETTTELESSGEMLTVSLDTPIEETEETRVRETTPPVSPPVTQKKSEGAETGIVIIGSSEETMEAYNCGVSGHHCNGPEAHAFIVELEEKGCSFCGSHSCPSFYAVDEWGNAGYDAKSCPQYSEQKDPLYYCQDCGRKVGNGYNNTCLRFLVDVACPDCGQQVAARTCHSHE